MERTGQRYRWLVANTRVDVRPRLVEVKFATPVEPQNTRTSDATKRYLSRYRRMLKCCFFFPKTT